MGWWSIWLLVGVLCIGLELIIPGLVIIFFGFGAVFTSVFSLIPFINLLLFLRVLFSIRIKKATKKGKSLPMLLKRFFITRKAE